MSRTSEYRKPSSVTRQAFDPGSQIVVTVESVFDGGIIAFARDSTGNEYRGALLGVDNSQTLGPTVLKNCSEIANPLTVIHDHNYHHNIKESVLKVTRAVPSQVLLSWGSLPKLAQQDQEKDEGTTVHGLASREHKRVPVEYNTKSAEVWSRPPPQPTANNHELWVPSTITNSFSRAAKSSALYKIGVSIRNQQRPNRKRKLFTPSPSQSTSASMLTPINNSPLNNSEDSQSIASDEGSLSPSYSSSSQTSSEMGTRPLKEFSLKVPKLELNK